MRAICGLTEVLCSVCPIGGVILTFVGLSSSPVPGGHLPNAGRSFVPLAVLFAYVNEASFTYSSQQLSEGDRKLLLVRVQRRLEL